MIDKKLMRDLVKLGEYREKSRFQFAYNAIIYTISYGFIGFLGTKTPFFTQDTLAYISTFIGLYGVGAVIAGISIYDENKRIKNYFKKHHNIDITSKDLSKVNIEKLQHELELIKTQDGKKTRINKSPTSQDESKEKTKVLPAPYTFEGCERHRENTFAKVAKVLKREREKKR